METILLIDDEPSIISLAKLYLERDGFSVESAGDGLQGLEIVEKLHPGLLVLDVMLPGMDGFEVCRKIRAAGSQIPIIMLTARDEDIDKILGLELGADDYLTKPFNPRELVARVKAILRRSERPVQTGTAPVRL
ncbi:MAG: response regulator, partial [Chloroflexota bacterium]